MKGAISFAAAAWLAILALSLHGCVQARGWQVGRTADGCVTRDNCGLYPPYYSNAEACGPVRLECPTRRP